MAPEPSNNQQGDAIEVQPEEDPIDNSIGSPQIQERPAPEDEDPMTQRLQELIDVQEDLVNAINNAYPPSRDAGTMTNRNEEEE